MPQASDGFGDGGAAGRMVRRDEEQGFDEGVGVEEFEEARSGQSSGLEVAQALAPGGRISGEAGGRSVVEAAQAGEGGEAMFEPLGGVDQVRQAGGGFLLPEPQLPGEADFGASIEPGGGEGADRRGVANACADFAQGVDEGDIFKRFDGRQPSGKAVDGGGAGERCAEVLQMAGPGVGGIGVEQGFEPGDQALVEAVTLIGEAGAGVEGVEVIGQELDGAADGVGSGFDFAQVGGDPVRMDESVGVRRKDGGVRGGEKFQAIAGEVHQGAARGAHVGLCRGKVAGKQAQEKAWVAAGVALSDGEAAVGAVIEQQQDFVGVVRQRRSAVIDLQAQGVERGGEDGFFVARGNDDNGAAARIWCRQDGSVDPRRASVSGVRREHRVRRRKGKGCAHAGRGSASGSRCGVERCSRVARSSQAWLAQRRSAPW